MGGEIAVGLTILSELSPTRVRGLFVSLFNTVSGGLGNFLTFAYVLLVLGAFNALVAAGPDGWRWAFGLLFVPVVLVAFFRRYLPESPAYLLSKGDIEGTNRALTRLDRGILVLRPNDTVGKYVDETTLAISESGGNTQAPGSVWQAILRPALLRRTALLGFVAFIAWGFEFSYNIGLPLLLVSQGFSISSSLMFTMLTHTGALVGAIAASALSGLVPRRIVMLIAGFGGAAVLISFALFANEAVTIIIFGFLARAFMMLGNTTIWMWSPELFPTRVRALGAALIVNIGFLGGAIVPLFTVPIMDSAGVLVAFCVLGGLYIVMGVSALFVPETKGKSLEELHRDHAPVKAAKRRGAVVTDLADDATPANGRSSETLSDK